MTDILTLEQKLQSTRELLSNPENLADMFGVQEPLAIIEIRSYRERMRHEIICRATDQERLFKVFIDNGWKPKIIDKDPSRFPKQGYNLVTAAELSAFTNRTTFLEHVFEKELSQLAIDFTDKIIKNAETTFSSRAELLAQLVYDLYSVDLSKYSLPDNLFNDILLSPSLKSVLKDSITLLVQIIINFSHHLELSLPSPSDRELITSKQLLDYIHKLANGSGNSTGINCGTMLDRTTIKLDKKGISIELKDDMFDIQGQAKMADSWESMIRFLNDRGIKLAAAKDSYIFVGFGTSTNCPVYKPFYQPKVFEHFTKIMRNYIILPNDEEEF